MARSLQFSDGNESFSVPIEKLDRNKLYGWVDKKYYDRDGSECYFGSLSSDGVSLFGRESFEMGYLNEQGEWCDRSQLTAVDLEGQPLEKVESSFKQTLMLDKTVSHDEFLDHVIKSVYQLDHPELLAKVKACEGIFTFPFNYNASISPDPAFLIESDDTLFMLIGQAAGFDFIEPHQVESALLIEDDEDEDDDDIDFSLF